MTINIYSAFDAKQLKSIVLLVCIILISAFPAAGQDQQNGSGIQPLRSDVGINGLTANFHWAGDFRYLKSDSLLMSADSLQTDGSSELEIVFRDLRMLTPRLGVGFQVLTSFFVDSPNASFGIGSWGLGPVVRAYPFETDRFQPYVQANAMMGNNLALNTFANTKQGGTGFRVRLGLRGGAAFRITNGLGLFFEAGPDWESSRLFKAEALNWQFNFGIDVYRFK